MTKPIDLKDRLEGVLLGTAIGDALGLPAEGLKPERIARRFGRLDRYRLLGSTGFVSDDTEQAALVAQSLLRAPNDLDRFVRLFRRSMLGWFLRMPWGIGMATLRACCRIAVGLRRSGVDSAGNGAAMRAAVVGAFFDAREQERRRYGEALARVTHEDERAVEGALFVAELTARLVSADPVDPVSAARDVIAGVRSEPLKSALSDALVLASSGAELEVAARRLGTTGFVLHSVPVALFAFLSFGDRPADALQAIVLAGGDTDSNGAIVGAWLGARHGRTGLPTAFVDNLQPGPFGRAHLLSLAGALAELRAGSRPRPVRFSTALALLRNLALFPVILAHGFRRLVP